MKRVLLGVFLLGCGQAPVPTVQGSTVASAAPARHGVAGPVVAQSDGGMTSIEAVPTAVPTGDVSSAPGANSGSPVPGADQSIAAARGKLRACYNRGLARTPGLEGSVVVVAVVDADGKVASTKTDKRVGLGDEVVACLALVVETVRFAKTDDGASHTVSVPLLFVAGPPSVPSAPAPSASTRGNPQRL
jgi:hypothetical protein